MSLHKSSPVILLVFIQNKKVLLSGNPVLGAIPLHLVKILILDFLNLWLFYNGMHLSWVKRGTSGRVK